jgi:hypothetical protein
LTSHLQIDADPVPDPAYHLDADPDADADPAYHFDADPDADVDTAYHLYADPDADSDPNFYLMRMRIQVTKMMRIHADADPIPQHRDEITICYRWRGTWT